MLLRIQALRIIGTKFQINERELYEGDSIMALLISKHWHGFMAWELLKLRDKFSYFYIYIYQLLSFLFLIVTRG